MRYVKFLVVAAALGLSACNGPNPDPNAGNAMGEYRGPGTIQAAPARNPVQPDGGSMAIPPASGGMIVAAPAREAQQPQGGANAIPPATGVVTRSTR